LPTPRRPRSPNLRGLFTVGTETSSASGKKNKMAVEVKSGKQLRSDDSFESLDSQTQAQLFEELQNI